MPRQAGPPQPCPTCPWRRDRDASTIPGFDLALAEGLAGTCGAPGQEVQLGRPMMACHGSPEGAERVCIGWARQVGWWHLGARVAALGDGPMAEAMRAGPSPDLHPTWAEVIDKLRGSA